jgi:HAD superfamily hydrolase (TIGR01549 family)
MPPGMRFRLGGKMRYGVVLDLDGTFYRLRSPDGTFEKSDLWKAIGVNARHFLRRRTNLRARAVDEFIQGSGKGKGLSVAAERQLGISRAEWFNNVWDLDPRAFVIPTSSNLVADLAPFDGRSVIVTSGPRIWARRVLELLSVSHLFNEDQLITGEPDLRKPDPQIFLHGAKLLDRKPEEVVSVGDSYASDILPAKSVGMRTVLIGDDSRAECRVPSLPLALRLIRVWERD